MAVARIIGASRFKGLGLDCWPVTTPLFLDPFQDGEHVRALQTKRFNSEEEAIAFLREQPLPRFIYEPRDPGPYVSESEVDELIVRFSCGDSEVK